jgi:type IV pilus assembly protein PilV
MLTMTRTRISRGSTRRSLRRRALGMSLIEVMVSMAIFAVGVLGLFSAHANAFNSYADAKYRADATMLADQLISEIWVDRANVADYAYAGGGQATLTRISPWLARLRQALPTADAVVQVAGTQVQVTVTWQPRNGDARTHRAVATLQEP